MRCGVRAAGQPLRAAVKDGPHKYSLGGDQLGAVGAAFGG
jgi:hypothetical protein